MTPPPRDDTTEVSMSTDTRPDPAPAAPAAPEATEAPAVPAGVPDDLSGSTAPMPTARTIRQRSSLPVQAVRFSAVSLKMMRMILRSHD
jgi:hypothetical protein